jgi:hypothetical protein
MEAPCGDLIYAISPNPDKNNIPNGGTDVTQSIKDFDRVKSDMTYFISEDNDAGPDPRSIDAGAHIATIMVNFRRCAFVAVLMWLFCGYFRSADGYAAMIQAVQMEGNDSVARRAMVKHKNENTANTPPTSERPSPIGPTASFAEINTDPLHETQPNISPFAAEFGTDIPPSAVEFSALQLDMRGIPANGHPPALTLPPDQAAIFPAHPNLIFHKDFIVRLSRSEIISHLQNSISPTYGPMFACRLNTDGKVEEKGTITFSLANDFSGRMQCYFSTSNENSNPCKEGTYLIPTQDNEHRIIYVGQQGMLIDMTSYKLTNRLSRGDVPNDSPISVRVARLQQGENNQCQYDANQQQWINIAANGEITLPGSQLQDGLWVILELDQHYSSNHSEVVEKCFLSQNGRVEYASQQNSVTPIETSITTHAYTLSRSNDPSDLSTARDILSIEEAKEKIYDFNTDQRGPSITATLGKYDVLAINHFLSRPYQVRKMNDFGKIESEPKEGYKICFHRSNTSGIIFVNTCEANSSSLEMLKGGTYLIPFKNNKFVKFQVDDSTGRLIDLIEWMVPNVAQVPIKSIEQNIQNRYCAVRPIVLDEGKFYYDRNQLFGIEFADAEKNALKTSDQLLAPGHYVVLTWNESRWIISDRYITIGEGDKVVEIEDGNLIDKEFPCYHMGKMHLVANPENSNYTDPNIEGSQCIGNIVPQKNVKARTSYHLGSGDHDKTPLGKAIFDNLNENDSVFAVVAIRANPATDTYTFLDVKFTKGESGDILCGSNNEAPMKNMDCKLLFWADTSHNACYLADFSTNNNGIVTFPDSLEKSTPLPQYPNPKETIQEEINPSSTHPSPQSTVISPQKLNLRQDAGPIRNIIAMMGNNEEIILQNCRPSHLTLTENKSLLIKKNPDGNIFAYKYIDQESKEEPADSGTYLHTLSESMKSDQFTHITLTVAKDGQLTQKIPFSLNSSSIMTRGKDFKYTGHVLEIVKTNTKTTQYDYNSKIPCQITNDNCVNTSTQKPLKTGNYVAIEENGGVNAQWFEVGANGIIIEPEKQISTSSTTKDKPSSS